MSAKALRVAPVLLVKDLLASVAFWRDSLGFHAERLYHEPPTFAMPARDGVTVMLAQTPAGKEPPPANWRVAGGTNQIYIWTDDAAALHAEYVAKGVPMDFDLYDTPWGTREFGVQDLDDHDIAFGQAL